MGYYDSTPLDDIPQIVDRLPQASGYGQLRHILELADNEELFEALRAYNRTGRPPYPVDAMWRVVLCKYLLSIRYNIELVQLLRTDPRLREVCGLGDRVPSESMVSRFFKRLTAHQDLIDEAIRALISKIARLIDNQSALTDEGVGSMIAIDSTDVPSFSNPNPRRNCPVSDPEARWGHKTSTRTKKGAEKVEWTFGYKVHLICDAVYGVPLTYIILPANESDSRQLPELVSKLMAEQPWIEPQWLLADKGYDSNRNWRWLDDRMIDPVILMRDLYKPGDLYDAKGRVVCTGGQAMEYVETDPSLGHLFRCPPEGCHLKGQLAFSLYCQDSYENPDDPNDHDLLRRVGRVARASKEFKDLYSNRQTIERLFGSAKQSRLLATHRYYRLFKVRLHVALSIMTYLLTMLNRVMVGRMDQLRRMRIRLPNQAITANHPPLLPSTVIVQRDSN
ncbi:MAG: transposase [Chloroflexi bacterium]|nr:transposase [Chloroflexota bacterium]